MSKCLLWFRVIEDDRTTYFYKFEVAKGYLKVHADNDAKIQRYFQIPGWPTPPTAENSSGLVSWLDIGEEVRNGTR